MTLDQAIHVTHCELMNKQAEIKRAEEICAELKEKLVGLREKKLGLVPEETVVVESRGRGRRALYVGPYYSSWRSDFGWIKARPFKKDGTPGKRVVTFYDWEIE